MRPRPREVHKHAVRHPWARARAFAVALRSNAVEKRALRLRADSSARGRGHDALDAHRVPLNPRGSPRSEPVLSTSLITAPTVGPPRTPAPEPDADRGQARGESVWGSDPESWLLFSHGRRGGGQAGRRRCLRRRYVRSSVRAGGRSSRERRIQSSPAYCHWRAAVIAGRRSTVPAATGMELFASRPL